MPRASSLTMVPIASRPCTDGAITVDANLLPGDSSGDGDEQLLVPGQIIIAGSVGGGGLGNITLEADDVEVQSGAKLSSRQVASGGNPFTDPSIADSGTIAILAPLIDIGAGAELQADATGLFGTGDITLTARLADYCLVSVAGELTIPQPRYQRNHRYRSGTPN